MPDTVHILQVGPETLLRRTVSMTARSFGRNQVHETAGSDQVSRMLRQCRF